MDLYLASAKDLETVDCFLDFPDTKESPRKMVYPVTDLLVSRHAAQSASANPFKCKSVVAENISPLPGSLFKYYNTLCAASKCGLLDLDINWLSLWTANVMSGLVIVKYKSLPTSLL